MRAHYLQHVPFEGLGSIETWLLAAGYTITSSQRYQSDELPSPQDIDMLIVMGGPMSINDEQDYPWLVTEKRFIKQVIDLGKPVLGICLGAQLIANVLGAQVYPNAEKEIGWFPVNRIDTIPDYVFQFPKEMPAFHWHGETFGLPEHAVHLAKSEACQNQAFQFGDSVIGLQFHLETTPESAAILVEQCANELTPGIFVQSVDKILMAGADKYEAINQMMAEILSYLHQRVSVA